MKKRPIYIVVVFLLLCVLLTACNSANYDHLGSSPGGNDNSESIVEGDTEGEEIIAAERKIIYSVYTTIYADNLDDAIDTIKKSLAADEWMDYESISSTYARFVARVKSDRIDEYVADISEDNNVRSYEKSARDVSLNYQDKEAQITALETERGRLIELIEEASVEEMILINTRLAQITLEINTLQGDLNRYDSLIDYSEITIILYEKSAAPEQVAFGARLGNIFKGAWVALGAFFAAIVIALTAAFPFIVVLGPVGVGIFFLTKFIKRKKKAKFIAPPKEPKKPKDNN